MALMEQEPVPQEEAPTPPGEESNPILEKISGEIESRIEEQYRPAVDQLVTAGKSLMYSPKTHELALQQLSKSSDLYTGAALGIVALMSLLIGRAKGKPPGEAIFPAAMLLLLDALEFLSSGGQIDLNPKDVARAFDVLVRTLANKLGLGPEGIQPPPPAEEQGAAMPQQGAPMPPQGAPMPPQQGLINRAGA